MNKEELKNKVIEFTKLHYSGIINGYDHALRLLRNKDDEYPEEVEGLIKMINEGEG